MMPRCWIVYSEVLQPPNPSLPAFAGVTGRDAPDNVRSTSQFPLYQVPFTTRSSGSARNSAASPSFGSVSTRNQCSCHVGTRSHLGSSQIENRSGEKSVASIWAPQTEPDIVASVKNSCHPSIYGMALSHETEFSNGRPAGLGSTCPAPLRRHLESASHAATRYQ